MLIPDKGQLITKLLAIYYQIWSFSRQL